MMKRKWQANRTGRNGEKVPYVGFLMMLIQRLIENRNYKINLGWGSVL